MRTYASHEFTHCKRILLKAVSERRSQFFTDIIESAVRKAEVLCLVIPEGTADSVLLKDGMNVLLPAQGILSRGLINDSVLSAI